MFVRKTFKRIFPAYFLNPVPRDFTHRCHIESSFSRSAHVRHFFPLSIRRVVSTSKKQRVRCVRNPFRNRVECVTVRVVDSEPIESAELISGSSIPFLIRKPKINRVDFIFSKDLVKRFRFRFENWKRRRIAN